MKRKVLLAALAAVSIAAGAVDTPSNDSARAPAVSERLTAARNAIVGKDWGRAMRELNAALREDPRNADVHNLLGYSYRKRSSPDLARAFEHYGMALRLEPTHRGAHEYIGEAYLMDGKPAEAEKHLAELERICGGKTCGEYVDLAQSISTYKSSHAKN
jgi:Flp pilus assembly protein TadD